MALERAETVLLASSGATAYLRRAGIILGALVAISGCAHQKPGGYALGRVMVDGKPVPIAVDAQGLIPAMGWCEAEQRWQQIAVDSKGRVILSTKETK